MARFIYLYDYAFGIILRTLVLQNFEKSSNMIRIWQKKFLVQLALNPFLKETAGNLNQDFKYLFRHYKYINFVHVVKGV